VNGFAFGNYGTGPVAGLVVVASLAAATAGVVNAGAPGSAATLTYPTGSGGTRRLIT